MKDGGFDNKFVNPRDTKDCQQVCEARERKGSDFYRSLRDHDSANILIL